MHISLSFLFTWNWNDEYFHTLPLIPLKTYPIPDQNRLSLYTVPVFRQKRRKNHTLRGGTYLYGLYKGVPPRILIKRSFHQNDLVLQPFHFSITLPCYLGKSSVEKKAFWTNMWRNHLIKVAFQRLRRDGLRSSHA